MIRENSVDLIIDLLSKIITYGFINGMNLSSVESKLINSSIIKDIENGDDSFLYNNFNDELIIKNIYGLSADTNFKMNKIACWIAEAYVNIFFKYKKSFSFILLYLPIDEMKFLFDKYHEVSFEYLYILYEKKIKEKTIIRLLIEKEKITQSKLAILTGININVINKYNRDNKYIFGAGYDNIYKLSRVLKVNPNIFLNQLDINTDTSIYKFDKTDPIYRSFLGYYYLCYYDSKINLDNYLFIEKGNYFQNKQHKKIYVRFVNYGNDNLSNLAEGLSNSLDKKDNIILCLFDFNDIPFDKYKCNFYRKLGFKNVYIINQFGLLNTKNRNVMVTIDKYNVVVDLINRAKNSAFNYQNK